MQSTNQQQSSRTPIKHQSNTSNNNNSNNKSTLYKSECEILIDIWRQGYIELTESIIILTYLIDESSNEIENIEIELKHIKLYSKEELLKMISYHDKHILALYFSNKNFNLILSLKDQIHFEFLYDKLMTFINVIENNSSYIRNEKYVSSASYINSSMYNNNSNKENSKNSINKHMQNSTPSKNINMTCLKPSNISSNKNVNNLIKKNNITPSKEAKEGKEGKFLHSKKSSIGFGCSIKENPSSAYKDKGVKTRKTINLNDVSIGNINTNMKNKSPCNKHINNNNENLMQSNIYNNQSNLYQRLIDNASNNTNSNIKNFSKSSNINNIIMTIPNDNKISNFNKNISISNTIKDVKDVKDSRIGLKDNINIFSEEDLILTKQDQDETIGELIKDLSNLRNMNTFKMNIHNHNHLNQQTNQYSSSNHQLPSNLYVNSYINSKEIDKDIVIKYINPEVNSNISNNQYSSVSAPYNKLNNIKSNQLNNIPTAKSLKVSIDNDTNSISNTNTNINTQMDINMDINTKDSKETKSKEEIIKSLSEKIDNSEELIFDSFILKLSLKDNHLKKEDLGKIYKSLNRSFAKSQILSEMIAILSRRFLVKSIDKTLLEMRKNQKSYFPIKQQKSIELCITDIFNIFLGNSEISNEFYLKILPSYLCEVFEIDYILDIKKNISLACLFVIMQFHHKIYFYDNTDINFNLEKPFLTQDIKYISIKNTIKWFNSQVLYGNEIDNDRRKEECNLNCVNLNVMTSIANINKAISGNIHNNIHSKHNINDIPNINDISYSYINRFTYKNFEIKESIEGFIKKNKSFCRQEDESRLDLFKFIYCLISIKDYEMALFICDQYSQKYSETLFLNPFLYLILSEIYSEFISIELGNNFFNKCVDLINWMYGNNKSPLLIDAYYTYSNILFKHIRNKHQQKIKDNLHEVDFNVDDNIIVNSNNENDCSEELYIGLINDYLEKTIQIGIDIFGNEHEKVIKPQLQKLLIQGFYVNNLFGYTMLDEIYVKFEVLVNKLNKKELFIEELLFINLFIEILHINEFKFKAKDSDGCEYKSDDGLINKVYAVVNKLSLRANKVKSLISIK